MQRKIAFLPGEYYHVYNRGIDRGRIFKDKSDWERFHKLLYLSNGTKPLYVRLIRDNPFEWQRGETLTNVLAYALMPNHFHLILREKDEKGISRFLEKLLTAYSMYFNTKYQRSGAVFCRPSRSKHIDSDEYFRWAFAYVHLNPIALLEADWKEKGLRDKEKAAQFMQSYIFSSFSDYFGKTRIEKNILETENLPIPEVHGFDAMLSELAATSTYEY